MPSAEAVAMENSSLREGMLCAVKTTAANSGASARAALVHFSRIVKKTVVGQQRVPPRLKGGWSSSGTQNMQSSTGQYSTQAGDPAQPVQHSVMTASSGGFFLRGVARPLDFGSNFNSSGTIPTALVAPGAAGMRAL